MRLIIYFRYETSTDDETTLLFEVKIESEDLPLAFSIEAVLNSPESSSIYKAVGNHELKASYNMSPSEGTFEMSGSYNDNEAKISLVKSRSEASFELSSNIPGFSSIKGQVKWMSRGTRTKYDFTLEMNRQKLFQGSFGHDFHPFTRFVLIFSDIPFSESNIQIFLSLDSKSRSFLMRKTNKNWKSKNKIQMVLCYLLNGKPKPKELGPT